MINNACKTLARMLVLFREKHFAKWLIIFKDGAKRFSFAMGICAALLSFNSAQAVIETYKFEDPVQQEQFFRLNEELRCPQCQNQSIADSNSPVATDLRKEVYRMITEEQADDQEIIDFMLARYGDFVLYKPRMDARTIALWFGPLLLLLLGLFALLRLLKQHRPETDDEELDVQDQEELKKILGGKK